SHNLFFMIETLPGAIFETIEEFMRDRSDKHPLVILDTLGKVNAPAMANETHYQRDYRVAGRLKQLADSVPGGSILVVHHTRKQ
uniref:helicase RepA family protein n=1 Tax=Salmonella enterica TaxID=28901 RepID=UPI0020C24D96